MKDIYITQCGSLKRKENSLIFENSKGVVRIPVKDVNTIYIFSEVSFNSAVMNFLSKLKIPIYFFNHYGYYVGAFYPLEKNVSGKLLVEQVKAYLNLKVRISLAKNFLGAALHNMRKTLMQYNLLNEGDQLTKDNDLMNNIKTIERLLLFEAKKRQKYYKQFNKVIKNKDFKFIERVRRPPDNYINTLISFGNSLLYSTTLSEILKTPLDPRISYLHEPFERRFSLNLDLSEIFKPLIVDRVIFTLINKQIIKPDDFDKELNFCYLNDDGRKKFIREYDNKLKTVIKYPGLNRKVSYRYMIRLECYKLIKFLLEKKEYRPFKIYW